MSDTILGLPVTINPSLASSDSDRFEFGTLLDLANEMEKRFRKTIASIRSQAPERQRLIESCDVPTTLTIEPTSSVAIYGVPVVIDETVPIGIVRCVAHDGTVLCEIRV